MPRDFFAELYVAGILGDAGWSIYFPKRDVGFDFIATKKVNNNIVIRPVQVKGKYPERGTGDRSAYGYIGQLSQLHRDMVLAIPYFPVDTAGVAPTCTAYMPRSKIQTQRGRGYACQPAKRQGGEARPRRSFHEYFDRNGIQLIETDDWG